MRGTLIVTLIAAGVLLAGRGNAAEANPGRQAYLRYCSACHGSEGKGDGIVATVLRPKPPDLTQLAQQNGGTFPYLQVRDVVDGRKNIAAHGSTEMPVWGEVFGQQKAVTQSAAHVRGKVQLITDYLASIQAK